jgi:hypothetical protein
MKSSRKIYLFYEVTGGIVYGAFCAYQAIQGRASWAWLIIGLSVGILLAYVRWKYWLPVLDEVRERKKARRKAKPGESPPMNQT